MNLKTCCRLAVLEHIKLKMGMKPLRFMKKTLHKKTQNKLVLPGHDINLIHICLNSTWCNYLMS